MATKRIPRRVFGWLVGAVTLTATLIAVSTGPAAAQGEVSNATGIIVNGGRIGPADCPPGGGTAAPGTSTGLVTVGAVNASCSNAGAQASAASATIGTCPAACIQLGVLQSQCTTGPGGTAGSSVVVLNGGGVLPGGVISGTQTVNIAGLTVVLNEPINTATTRGANAAHITGLGLDVIIAQTQCTTAAGYPLSAGIDTDPVVQRLAPSSDAGSGGAPAWLVVTAAVAVLLAVNLVFAGSARRRAA